MDIDKDELMYVMLEDLYQKQTGEKEMPIGWYSYDVNKRIDILNEALNSNKKVIDTNGYYNVMEKVIIDNEKIK